MRVKEALRLVTSLGILLTLVNTRLRADSVECLQRCSVVLGAGDNAVSAAQYDNCMNSCRNQAPALPDGWIVIAISEPDFAAGVAHGFISKDEAITEAMTVCRRNHGSECKVAISGVNTCMALADSVNSKWIWSATARDSRALAVKDALAECRRRGGENCLIRSTPCSDDDRRFPSPFEPASVAAVVDPKTTGTWQLQVGQSRWVWSIDRRGTYQLDTGNGSKSVGSFASNGKVWELHSSTGIIDGGVYTIQAPDLFVATGKLGTGNWRRITGNP